MNDCSPLHDLARFPLLKAMFGRRSRRFGLGMRIPDGPLAYTSVHAPIPLSDLERTVLLLCGAGVSGWNFGMEHTAKGDPELGCNYPVRLTGRTAPSAAGIETAELIVSDDAGALITRLRDLDPKRLRELQGEGDLTRLISEVESHYVRLSDTRVQLPAASPHVSSHNIWNANRPGATLFIPIVDLTQQLLDFLAIYLAGETIPWDTTHDRPCGDLDWFI